jgi:hypothetical protein
MIYGGVLTDIEPGRNKNSVTTPMLFKTMGFSSNMPTAYYYKKSKFGNKIPTPF